jgi:hypothetical protein
VTQAIRFIVCEAQNLDKLAAATSPRRDSCRRVVLHVVDHHPSWRGDSTLGRWTTSLADHNFIMASLGKRPTSSRDGLVPTKLQWTFRLLDAITQRNCWIGDSSRTVENMMEAEIVPSCQEGSFPDRFDWETLAEHWNWKCDAVTLYNEAIINVHSDREVYGRISERLRPPDRSRVGQPVLGEQLFHVLWLSPSVFISNSKFEIYTRDSGRISLWDYIYRLSVRDTEKIFRFYAYALSTFEDKRVPPRLGNVSFQSVQFFHQVTASLPADYFSFLAFEKGRHQFPANYVPPLLAVLRTQADDVFTNRPWTKVFLGAYLYFENEYQKCTREELEALSHVFHSKVHVSFESFEKSVSIFDLNRFLLGPSPPGSVSVGSHHFVPERFGPEQDDFPAREITFESSALQLCLSGFSLSFSGSCLNEILRVHHVKALEVVIPSCIWGAGLEHVRERLACFSRRFLEEHSVLERLAFVVNREPVVSELRRDALWWAACTPPCKSRKLRVCNLSFRVEDKNCRGYHYSPLKRIKRWDEVMVPALVLNFYRNVASTPLTSGIITLVLQSINVGKVYQKTTNHVPYDVSIANSGLIFQIVRGMTKQV